MKFKGIHKRAYPIGWAFFLSTQFLQVNFDKVSTPKKVCINLSTNLYLNYENSKTITKSAAKAM